MSKQLQAMMYRVKFKDNEWHVIKGSRSITKFNNREDAIDYVQSCLEDNNWNAMNRD